MIFEGSVDWENYSLWFLPFCPFVLLPFCPFTLMPLPLPPSWFSCLFKFWRLSREDIFVFVLTIRLVCRYRQLSWCYSCLHRWQLWPSSLGVKQRLCPFWLQMLKLYLKIWSLGGGQGAGADHHEILEYESPSQKLLVLTFKCLMNRTQLLLR